MKTAIVILNYNGWRDTKKCLAALSKQTVQDFEIYLIDNGSQDNSIEELSKIEIPNLHFRKEKKNTGFTGGVNIGIKWALENNFENIVLLNNDANAEPEWLENLLKPLEKSPEIGAVTSLMLDKTGELIDDAGDVYSTWGIPMLRNENGPKANAPESGLVFGATGGATLYRAKVFETIGFFDEDFFAYNEDVDIDWRMQLAGFKVWYEKSAVVWHKHSATSSKIPGFTINQVFKNLPQVFWKNVPSPMIWWMLPKFMLVYTAFIFYQIPKGGLKFALKGLGQSLVLMPKSLKKRRRIQASKAVSNQYISSILYHGLPLKQVNRIKDLLKIKH
ncbi:MAG: glycosyltransferase family 2 protein [bacterium]|nr:glycosyltransferase family 2 protein [bacterium]MDO4872055.1 glycosyltransferase family 2 protein [bacterium]